MKRLILVTGLALATAIAAFSGCGGEGGTGTGAASGGPTGPATGAAGTGAAMTAATDTGAPAAGGYTVIEVKDGGTIKGTVTFDGDVPKLADIPVSKNPEFCGAAIPNHRLMVDATTKGIA